MKPIALAPHKTFCPPSWDWHHEGHSEVLNFWLVISGEGTWSTEDRCYPLHTGECFVQRLWKPCHGKHNPKKPIVVLWSHFSYKAPDGRMIHLPRHENQLPPVHLTLRDTPFMCRLMERVLDCWHARDYQTANQWFAMVIQEYSQQSLKTLPPGMTVKQRQEIETLRVAIREHPEHPYPIPSLAQKIGCTPGHFTRLFKQIVGVSPREYITACKIEVAKSLLHLSSQSIGEIADELRYNDIYHFSHHFKKRTGISPKNFRKS